MIRVNGKSIKLNGDPGESLAEFLRRNGEKSCKIGCAIGACGACTVFVTSSPATGPKSPRTLNACLAPVASLAGCEVATSQGLGKSKAGFHAIQERVGAFHASQCGFCTPGMVMACQGAKEKASGGGRSATGSSTSQDDGRSTLGNGSGLQDVEHRLDGNLCRCTGYRPLLDVFKSFAPGVDIEDLGLHSPLEAPITDGAAAPASLARDGDPVGKVVGQGLGEGKVWLFPESLSELTDLLEKNPSSGSGAPKIVAANTGSGIFKELWPSAPLVISVQRVREMRGIERTQDTVTVGAAVTIAELADFLSSTGTAGDRDGGTADGSTTTHGAQSPFEAMATVLRRVAGSHVRNAATIGGNLVLARCQRLESDVATLLSGWGATVHLTSGGAGAGARAGAGPAAAVGVLDFVGDEGSLEPGVVVTHVSLPVPAEGDYFWCHKVAPTYSNTHSIMNAALKLTLAGDSKAPPNDGAAAGAASQSAPTVISAARLVFGYMGTAGARVTRRALGAEKALAGSELSLESLVAALQAVVKDLSPAPDMQQYCRGTAQGLLLQALAPLLLRYAGHDLPPAVARLLQMPSLSPPAPVRGSQKFEAVTHESAPVGLPIEKDRVRLQASGEAVFTGDMDMPSGGLHAAFVTSTQARAAIAGIDATAALELPGVEAFISAKDLPKHRNLISYGVLAKADEPIFADERVEYYGQPLGLVVATSQAATTRAAQAVQVEYADIQQPIVTIPQAIEAGQLLDLSEMTGGESLVGDPQAAISGAELSLRGVELEIPSQYHFYMEPQVAMCVPDEGGSIKVYNSTQFADAAQEAVAHALGLRLHEVDVICRRVGGGFGGKLNRNVPLATACAVAADKLGRPVQLVLDRCVDMALVGGREPMRVTYDVGFTRDGTIQGLDVKCWLMSGAYFDCAWDALFMKEGVELCYAIPNMRADIKTCRGNLPPFTSTRAPGKPQGTLMMEHVLDAVAAACGLDPTLVRERNLAKAPEGPQGNGNEGTAKFTFSDPKSKIPASEYTLLQLWGRLKASCDYDSRLAAVDAFNAGSPWVKRGITITHSRFDTSIPCKPAAVAIYVDGSVLVYAAGAEVGQGLTTKVKQVAIMELSSVLPKGSGPIATELVRLGDNTTYVLPRGFLTGSSTTSEAACAGVRKACQELVGKLKPFAEKLGEKASWEAVVKAACSAGGPFDACKVSLLACANNDPSEGAAMPPSYVLFGAACSEVEINLLTGERQVLRSDLMIDCGRSMNPAADIGQAEGAFVQGLGCFLSEQVEHDRDTGRVLTASPWHYAIPTASSIPRVFNLDLLPGVRFDRGVLSSKAIGEPPLQLAASAFFAVQAAVRAAQQELRHLDTKQDQHGGSGDLASTMSPRSVVEGAAGPGFANGHGSSPGLLQVPAGLKNVKEAVGEFDMAAVLLSASKKS